MDSNSTVMVDSQADPENALPMAFLPDDLKNRLPTPQVIPADTYPNDRVLWIMSERENGVGVLRTQYGDGDQRDVRVAFLSEYPIDLTKYEDTVVEILKADLIAYAKTAQQTLADGGMSVNVGTTKSPITVWAATDLAGRINLNGIVSLAQLNPAFTTAWVQGTDTLTLDATAIQKVGVAVGTFVSGTYAGLSAILNQIDGGTITSTGEIDSSPAWPTPTA